MKGNKILIDSASPQERRNFLKKLAGVVAGTAALGGFTNLIAKKTYFGTELSTYQSSDSLTGSIIMAAYSGARTPRGWAYCNGQVLTISDFTALFSLLGTNFGGDGRSTFGLPDLRGRVPVGVGQSPGTSFRRPGDRGGFEVNKLVLSQMPTHTHTAVYTPATYSGSVKPKALNGRGAKVDDPTNNYLANSNGVNIYAGTNNVEMGQLPVTLEISDPGSVTIDNTGGSDSFGIMQPWTCVCFLICTEGLYPSWE